MKLHRLWVLCSLLICGLLTTSAWAEGPATAYSSTQGVLLDGSPVEFQTYCLKDQNGNDTNYVKLRDVAYLLSGTSAQFEVSWDGAVNILTGQSYTLTGSEMTTPFSGDHTYTLGGAETTVNGQTVALDSIVLTDEATGGAYTYYKLRDLGSALGFTVGWDQETGIYIQTTALSTEDVQTDTVTVADPTVGWTYYDDQPAEVPETAEDFRVLFRYMLKNGVTQYTVTLSGKQVYTGGAKGYIEDLSQIMREGYDLAGSDYWEYKAFYSGLALNYSWAPVTGKSDTFRNLSYTLSLIPQNDMTEAEVQQALADFEDICDDILNTLTLSGDLTEDMTGKEKAQVLFRYVTQRLTYNLRYVQATPLQVLQDDNAVCSGYTAIFSALAHKLGMPIYSVGGTAKGLNHIWNAIDVDGETYYIDATWGDTGKTYDNMGYFWATKELMMTLDPTRVFDENGLTL
jgi:hypothetical protein